MKIVQLPKTTPVYTCNSYLVLGSWNSIEDVNTLVDVGTDGSIIDAIELISTGVGKTPVEQVVLTHNHFDHSGGLAAIKKKYNPRVYAFSRFEGVDSLLEDGQILRFGDREFEVIHAPGHSDDSICLYCKKDKTLFSGDTPLRIMTLEGGYHEAFVQALERIMRLEISVIYSGHDQPCVTNIPTMLERTLGNAKNAKSIMSNVLRNTG
jgi:glyoxylase-like metal-dependent hydrolase (beta-lactamase superfamily II)